jgi:hypothetical protein
MECCPHRHGLADRVGGERFEAAVNVLAETGHARTTDEDGCMESA